MTSIVFNPSSFSGRTMTGTANQITVTNGDGISGNPTFSIPSAFITTGTITVGDTSATTTQLYVKGGASGTDMFVLDRSTSKFSFALVGGGLSFKDVTNSAVILNLFSQSSTNALYMGQFGAATDITSRPNLIAGSSIQAGVATNAAAPVTRIRAAGGSGTGTPGGLTFSVGVAAASGTGIHTFTDVLTIAGGTGAAVFTGPVTARITKRVQSASDATSITPDIDSYDMVKQANTQAAGTLTINAPTGTPTAGQEFILRIKSTNAQTFSFNSIYRGSLDTALPVTSTASSLTDYMKFIYNSDDSKWDLIALSMGY